MLSPTFALLALFWGVLSPAMGLIPQSLLRACLKIRGSGRQLENDVFLRAQITPCQSLPHKPHFHRADIESLQWDQRRP